MCIADIADLPRQSSRDDAVTHPAHYTQGKIEVLDFILDQNLPYLAGQVVKYVARYRWKSRPVEDLRKARFYLDRLIEEERRKDRGGYAALQQE